MAWTTPRTWTTGEVVTKTIMDTHVRDNLNALASLDFAQITSDTAAISATTDATAVDVVAGNAVTYAASPVIIWFSCQDVVASVASVVATFNLYDDTTDLGRVANVEIGTSGNMNSISFWHRYTPTAASHTFKIRAWVNTGNIIVKAGAGGVATYRPAQLRVTPA